MKPPKCRYCGNDYVKFKSTQVVCSHSCAVKLAKKNRVDAEVKQLKIKVTDWRKKLQSKVQEIARLIDYGLPCLATGKDAKQYHGGHVYSRGGNKNIALNLHNIHRQSAQSNHYQADDVLMREGLVREYGQEYLDKLTELKGFVMPKYSNDEYMAMYEIACNEANRLKKDKRVRSVSERIAERDRVNLCLGIYTNTFSPTAKAL